MNRQILVYPDDQRYQLTIWRETPSVPINHYKVNTVTYVTRAAPYLATKCLQKITDETAIKYPYGSQMLRDNFYVDDGRGESDILTIVIETQRNLYIFCKVTILI